MSIRIRRARRGDASELTRIAHAAKRFWGYPARLIRLWEADLTVTPEFIAEHQVYCAAREGAVVGFYAVSGEDSTRELDHLWVEPNRIRSGIGCLLFSHLLSHLRRLGVARLMIASDPNAVGFYQRLGARRIGAVSSRPRGRRLPRLVFRLRPSRRSNNVLQRTRRPLAHDGRVPRAARR